MSHHTQTSIAWPFSLLCVNQIQNERIGNVSFDDYSGSSTCQVFCDSSSSSSTSSTAEQVAFASCFNNNDNNNNRQYPSQLERASALSIRGANKNSLLLLPSTLQVRGHSLKMNFKGHVFLSDVFQEFLDISSLVKLSPEELTGNNNNNKKNEKTMKFVSLVPRTFKRISGGPDHLEKHNARGELKFCGLVLVYTISFEYLISNNNNKTSTGTTNQIPQNHNQKQNENNDDDEDADSFDDEIASVFGDRISTAAGRSFFHFDDRSSNNNNNNNNLTNLNNFRRSIKSRELFYCEWSRIPSSSVNAADATESQNISKEILSSRVSLTSFGKKLLFLPIANMNNLNSCSSSETMKNVLLAKLLQQQQKRRKTDFHSIVGGTTSLELVSGYKCDRTPAKFILVNNVTPFFKTETTSTTHRVNAEISAATTNYEKGGVGTTNKSINKKTDPPPTYVQSSGEIFELLPIDGGKSSSGKDNNNNNVHEHLALPKVSVQRMWRDPMFSDRVVCLIKNSANSIGSSSLSISVLSLDNPNVSFFPVSSFGGDASQNNNSIITNNSNPNGSSSPLSSPSNSNNNNNNNVSTVPATTLIQKCEIQRFFVTSETGLQISDLTDDSHSVAFIIGDNVSVIREVLLCFTTASSSSASFSNTFSGISAGSSNSKKIAILKAHRSNSQCGTQSIFLNALTSLSSSGFDGASGGVVGNVSFALLRAPELIIACVPLCCSSSLSSSIYIFDTVFPKAILRISVNEFTRQLFPHGNNDHNFNITLPSDGLFVKTWGSSGGGHWQIRKERIMLCSNLVTSPFSSDHTTASSITNISSSSFLYSILHFNTDSVLQTVASLLRNSKESHQGIGFFSSSSSSSANENHNNYHSTTLAHRSDAKTIAHLLYIIPRLEKSIILSSTSSSQNFNNTTDDDEKTKITNNISASMILNRSSLPSLAFVQSLKDALFSTANETSHLLPSCCRYGAMMLSGWIDAELRARWDGALRSSFPDDMISSIVMTSKTNNNNNNNNVMMMSTENDNNNNNSSKKPNRVISFTDSSDKKVNNRNPELVSVLFAQKERQKCEFCHYSYRDLMDTSSPPSVVASCEDHPITILPVSDWVKISARMQGSRMKFLTREYVRQVKKEISLMKRQQKIMREMKQQEMAVKKQENNRVAEFMGIVPVPNRNNGNQNNNSSSKHQQATTDSLTAQYKSSSSTIRKYSSSSSSSHHHPGDNNNNEKNSITHASVQTQGQMYAQQLLKQKAAAAAHAGSTATAPTLSVSSPGKNDGTKNTASRGMMNTTSTSHLAVNPSNYQSQRQHSPSSPHQNVSNQLRTHPGRNGKKSNSDTSSSEEDSDADDGDDDDEHGGEGQHKTSSTRRSNKRNEFQQQKFISETLDSVRLVWKTVADLLLSNSSSCAFSAKNSSPYLLSLQKLHLRFLFYEACELTALGLDGGFFSVSPSQQQKFSAAAAATSHSNNNNRNNNNNNKAASSFSQNDDDGTASGMRNENSIHEIHYFLERRRKLEMIMNASFEFANHVVWREIQKSFLFGNDNNHDNNNIHCLFPSSSPTRQQHSSLPNVQINNNDHKNIKADEIVVVVAEKSASPCTNSSAHQNSRQQHNGRNISPAAPSSTRRNETENNNYNKNKLDHDDDDARSSSSPLVYPSRGSLLQLPLPPNQHKRTRSNASNNNRSKSPRRHVTGINSADGLSPSIFSKGVLLNHPETRRDFAQVLPFRAYHRFEKFVCSDYNHLIEEQVVEQHQSVNNNVKPHSWMNVREFLSSF